MPSTTHACVPPPPQNRPQSVTKHDNPWMYECLTSLGRIVDLPVLINTSFNVRGQSSASGYLMYAAKDPLHATPDQFPLSPPSPSPPLPLPLPLSLSLSLPHARAHPRVRITRARLHACPPALQASQCLTMRPLPWSCCVPSQIWTMSSSKASYSVRPRAATEQPHCFAGTGD